MAFNSETGRRASSMRLPTHPRPFRDRLLEKIEMKRDGCWPWTATINQCGYGMIGVTGKNTIISAHRAMWIEHNGPIPDGLKVLHKCDNPPCCNPDHLFLGTHLDNMQDMINKGRARHPHGELSPRHKMTDEKVRTMRKLYADGATRCKLQDIFGLTKSGIEAIISGRVWKHVA